MLLYSDSRVRIFTGVIFMGRRDWEFKMKRDMIADSALELFTERSVDNVTLAEIADKIGYSKSSIYSYFKSKDDILLYIVDLADAEFHEMEGEIEKLLDDSTGMEFIEKIFDESIRKSYRSKKVAMLFHKNIQVLYKNDGHLFNKAMEIYERRIDWVASLLDKFLPANGRQINRLYSYLIMGSLHGLGHYELMEKKKLTERENYSVLMKFLYNALVPGADKEDK